MISEHQIKCIYLSIEAQAKNAREEWMKTHDPDLANYWRGKMDGFELAMGKLRLALEQAGIFPMAEDQTNPSPNE